MRAHQVGSSSAAASSYRTESNVDALTDKKIKDLNRKAQRAHYASHTERHEVSEAYRNTCDMHGFPKWLMWADGTWAPMDGSDRRVRRG